MADDAKDPRLEFIEANEWSPTNPPDLPPIKARPLHTPQEEATKRTRHKRAQRKRRTTRLKAAIAELESQNKRLLSASARALERCEVASDPSGAADEAASILAEVVALDGTYVPRDTDKPMFEPPELDPDLRAGRY